MAGWRAATKSFVLLTGLALLAPGLAAAQRPVLWAWGDNIHGQLGSGDLVERETPIEVTFFRDKTLTAIAAGHHHVLAVTADGRVWAWGSNMGGSLGLGDTTDRSVPTEVSFLTGQTVVAVSAGAIQSFALTSDGKLWAWGGNSAGALGLGDTTHRTLPEEVTFFAGRTLVEVCTNWLHSFARTSDGMVWAWGSNAHGVLGLGDTVDRWTPTQVTFFAGKTVQRLASGWDHAFAVTADHRLWGWGAFGALVFGSTDDELTPREVTFFTGMNLAPVAAGYYDTAVASPDGKLWTFGTNSQGQLGLGDYTYRSTPTEVPTFADSTVVALAAGERHVLAMTETGDVWCWGLNSRSELGLGDPVAARPTPTLNTLLSGRSVTGLWAGRNYGLALTTNTVPVADPQSATARTGVAKAITLTGSDGDGDALTYQIVSGPTHGSLTGTPPNVTYTAGDAHPGADSFTFKVNDGNDDSAPATVGITILPARTTLYTIDRSGTITQQVILRQYDLKRTTDNSLLVGRTISYQVDGTEVGTATTNAGGDSTLTWVTADGSATRTVRTEFVGDAAYEGSWDDATLTCQTQATKIFGVDREGRIASYRILKAWLYLLDNKPVRDKTVEFRLDGTDNGRDETNTSGVAQIGYTVQDGAGAGVRTIRADWPGDGGFLASTCTNTLTVLKATPYIWVMPRSVPQGGVARMYAYFRRLADYQKQEGKTVSFRVDGTWIADVVTGTGADAGIARYSYTTVEPPGVHVTRCEFAGDTWVDAGYGEATLTIY